MNIMDEDTNDLNESSADDCAEEEPLIKTQKRKTKTRDRISLKKIKYENISEGKTRKTTKSDLYKPPTVEELNDLKETQNLYNNNLFRLQINELVKEIRIKNKHKICFERWLGTFQTLMNDIPEYELKNSQIQSNIFDESAEERILMNTLAKDVKISCDQAEFVMRLSKPDKVGIFGLYKLNCLPGPVLRANINLTIPKTYFHAKDYLNNRYFVKRHHYLVYIAHYLRKKDICSKMSWILRGGNKALPILEVVPQDSQKIIIHIYATPPEQYFKNSRFLPDINNFKSTLEGAPATPYYNSTLVHDAVLSINHQHIEEILKDLINVQEAIKLIYIWLNQRELIVGFDENVVVYIIVYMVIKMKINKHMSSYQVVRNFWSFIIETNLEDNPIVICEHISNDIIEKYKQFFDIVILDQTGYYNVAALIDKNIYRKIRNECMLAFKLLDDGGLNSFQSLFIIKQPLELQFDLILSIKIDSNFTRIVNENACETIKYVHYEHLLAIKKISQVLLKGLNKRALNVVQLQSEEELVTVSFGINLDQCFAFHFLEMGPALNDPNENEFRQFWGPLASDRRFKDGSVCVAVYFETKTIKDKRNIIREIIDFLIKQKFGLNYDLHYNEVEELLVNKKIEGPYPLGTNEEACLKAIASSDELGKKLRSLEMPLTITGIQGVSEIFCFTDVFPPISTSYKYGKSITTISGNNIVIAERKVGTLPIFVPYIENVLHLEHSSKWPKSADGIAKMKTGFYLEISKLLLKKFQILSNVRPEGLNVFYDGFVFRYSIYLQREIGFLKKELIDNGVTAYKDTPESLRMQKDTDILPKIVGALKGIQAQHPSFGPSTALIKRWLRSHLIDDYYFPDVVINLLNASLYLNRSAFELSTAPQVAFFRFLKFFSDFHWNLQPIVVNFNEEISKEDLIEIDSKLLQNRDGHPQLYIVTPYDNFESIFTKNAPTKEVLRRTKQLATETLGYILKNIRGNPGQTLNEPSSTGNFDYKSLFVPNLDGFNVLIRLKPLLNTRRHEQVGVDTCGGRIKLQSYNDTVCNKFPITGFNPVDMYLKELRENYGHFAHFFHDSYGGNVIGVLWIPKALEQRDFKVAQVSGTKLKDGKLSLNIDGLIEDFYILGKDLVKSIDLN